MKRHLAWVAVATASFWVEGACSTSPNGASPPKDGGMDAVVLLDGGGDAGSDSGACPVSVTPGPGLVVTDRGPVRGVRDANGVWSYLGIPYATPPVGALRWAAPEAHACWTAPLDASAFGSMCMQLGGPLGTAAVGDEDCLFVNVWGPPSARAESFLPVVVFLHGGGDVAGSAASVYAPNKYTYDGATLATKTGALVVTSNFRLGAMAFLAHPSFDAHPGNYGVLDQIFVLRWVHDNIAAFGGDPARVLVFGQSTGADAVCHVVASPLAKGLLAAALMESGSCASVQTAAAAAAFAATFAQKLGCDSAKDPAACLRAVDASAVTLAFPNANSTGAWHYLPNVDGYVLPDVPWKVIASGAHNHVPFVVGSNSEETSQTWFANYPHGMTEEQYEAAALLAAGNDQSLANQVLALYPASAYGGDARAAAIAATTDNSFGCKARFVARTLAKGQSEPVWRYYFTHHIDDAAFGPLGAYHALELSFVFQQLSFMRNNGGTYVPSAAELLLADSLDGYWSRLASGDPNGEGAVAWPRYDATTDPYLQIDETTKTGAAFHSKECDFWDALAGR